MPSNPSPSSQSSLTLPGHQPALGRDIQDHLGRYLRLADEEMGPWAAPEHLTILADQLDHVLAVRDEAHLSEFRGGILEVRSSLRAFALSLTRNPDKADDLVQDTILRALRKRSSFQPGTNLNAWLFTILRNSFCSEYRKQGHEVADSDGAYSARLTVAPEQLDKLHFQDLQAALKKIAPDQLEALLLVGAQGLSYEEAAAACRSPVGTIKSRVNRARNRLAELLGYTAEDLARGCHLRAPAERPS